MLKSSSLRLLVVALILMPLFTHGDEATPAGTSGYNSFRDFPHLEARLRQRVPPAEAALALDAILRRDELDPKARVELFREFADYFRLLVPFEDHVDESITDEQFVRNAVASLYRQKVTDMQERISTAR
jgi:hypothetical protein